jgi:hypothetical protein
MKKNIIVILFLIYLCSGCTTNMHVKIKSEDINAFIYEVHLITPTSASSTRIDKTIGTNNEISQSFLLFSKRKNVLLLEISDNMGNKWAEGFFLKSKNLRTNREWSASLTPDFKCEPGQWLYILSNSKEFKNSKKDKYSFKINTMVEPWN